MPVPEAHRGKEKERMTVATNAARKVTGQVHVRTLNQWVEMHQTSGQGSRPKLKIQNTVMHTPQAVGVVAMAAEINASNVEKLDTSPTIAPMLLVRRLSEKVEVAAVAEEGLEVHNEGVHGSSEAGLQRLTINKAFSLWSQLFLVQLYVLVCRFSKGDAYETHRRAPSWFVATCWLLLSCDGVYRRTSRLNTVYTLHFLEKAVFLVDLPLWGSTPEFKDLTYSSPLLLRQN